MATTLEQLNASRDALIAELGNPAKMVRRSDGSEVQKASASDLLAQLTAIEELIREAGNAGGTRIALAQHRRGDGPFGPGDRGCNGGF